MRPATIVLTLVATFSAACTATSSAPAGNARAAKSSSAPSRDTVTEVRRGSSPLAALAERCGPLPRQVYRLGGEGGSAPLAGNSQPVLIRIRVGDRFAVWGRFAQRGLAQFSVHGENVAPVCGVLVPGPAGGPAEVFEARSAGDGRIITTTNDCAPCANLGFQAATQVLRRPPA